MLLMGGGVGRLADTWIGSWRWPYVRIWSIDTLLLLLLLRIGGSTDSSEGRGAALAAPRQRPELSGQALQKQYLRLDLLLNGLYFPPLRGCGGVCPQLRLVGGHQLQHAGHLLQNALVLTQRARIVSLRQRELTRLAQELQEMLRHNLCISIGAAIHISLLYFITLT
jgi:hypothetical protein